MKSIKKTICIALAVILAFTAFPFTSFAESYESFVITEPNVISEDGLWKYGLYKDEYGVANAWVSDYYGSEETVTVPSTLDGHNVKAIFSSLGLFYNCKDKEKIKKVVVSEGIEFIGSDSFQFLGEAEYVLPSTLKMIDRNSFAGRIIKAINFPEGLEGIASQAFLNAKFTDTDIVLPESLKYLANLAFSKSNITSVAIGKNTDISENYYSQTAGVMKREYASHSHSPFERCLSLNSVVIDENNPYLTVNDGVIYTSDYKYLIYAFGDFDELVIPDSVINICENALYNRSVNHLTIGAGITTLDRKMFLCSRIGTLDFSENTKIDTFPSIVFQSNPVDKVIIPASVKTIDNFAFSQTGIKELEFKENSRLEKIGDCAFESCELVFLNLSDCPSLQSIGNSAFAYSNALKYVDISKTKVNSIGTSAFAYCRALTTFEISPYTKKIDHYAFNNDAELEVINLENVSDYSTSAFQGCTKLNLESSVSESGEYEGFSYDEYDDHIVITGYSGEAADLVFPEEINSKPVTVIKHAGGREYNSVTLPSKLEIIGSHAFQYCNITEINDFPKTLKYIGDYAFSGDKFTEAKLNDGLEYIGSCAFQWVPLTSIEFPDSVTYLGGGNVHKTMESVTFGKNIGNIEELISPVESSRPKAFYISDGNPWYYSEYGILFNKDKTELIKDYYYYNQSEKPEEYSIPSTVKTIREHAFTYEKYIKKIIIPASVESLGNYTFSASKIEEAEFKDGFNSEALYGTFYNCTSLKKVTLSKNADVKTLYYTFSNSKLTSVNIPDSVESIWAAFENVPLSSADNRLTLPESLKAIGPRSFTGTRIKELTIPQGVQSIGDDAFNDSYISSIDLSNVKLLGRRTFANCTKLKEIDLTGVRYIAEQTPDSTFYKCTNLKKITYKKAQEKTEIGKSECKGMQALDTVVIGESINEIKDEAFADCTNLKSALICDSVEKIADNAFDNCSNLVIICPLNSSAMRFAKRNNIEYQTFKVAPVPDQKYTGRAIMPSLNVSVGTKTVKNGTDYGVTYSNNVNVGTARAVVIGKGDYSIFGAAVKFNIVSSQPQKSGGAADNKPSQSTVSKIKIARAKLRRIKRKKKSLTVKWKKQKKITGYQLQISRKKSFSGAQTINVGAKAKAYTFRNLKAKKRYYVRIRAYKKINGAYQYGKWSRIKSAKTK